MSELLDKHMYTEWQTFEKPENKRQMYDSQSTQALIPYI